MKAPINTTMPMTANRSYGGLPNGESALQRFKTASGRRVPLTDLLGVVIWYTYKD